MLTRYSLALALLLLLAAPALADEPVVEAAKPKAVAPYSKTPLWFRFEVGIEKKRLVTGFADAAREGGEDYGRFVLDHDGDGVTEAVFLFPMGRDWETGKPRPEPTLKLTYPEGTWQLELYSLPWAEKQEDGTSTVYMNWRFVKGESTVWFINGQARLYPDAASARQGKAIRLGPPFAFEVSTSTQGPKAVLGVGLTDGNEGTLRLAMFDGKERKISIRLAAGEEVKLDTPAEYG